MKKRALILAVAVLPVLAAGERRDRGRCVRRPEERRPPHSTMSRWRGTPGYGVTRLRQGWHAVHRPAWPRVRWASTCSTRRCSTTTIEADKPELLVYERRNDGSLKLVALEYLVFASRRGTGSKPSLFGQQFDDDPGRQPLRAARRSYALHAWIWKPQPERDPDRRATRASSCG